MNNTAARLRMLPAIILLAATASAAAQKKPPAAATEQIVGWHRKCAVSIQLGHGTLSAARTLGDDGKALSGDDSASWIVADYGRNEPGLSITWVRPQRTIDGSITLTDMVGKIQIYLRTPKKLPRQGLFRLKSSNDYGRAAALAVPMAVGADPRLASAAIELDDVIRYAAGLDTLYWSYRRVPQKRESNAVDAAGTIAVAPLREAVAALRDADRQLTAKAANFTTECKREPEYYDQLADI